MWHRAKRAIEEVYENTTLKDLVDEDRKRTLGDPTDYCI
jgi:DNA-binding IscR family transcriptional regulator